MKTLELSKEECKSLLSVLEAYKISSSRRGLPLLTPKHYKNVVAILNQLKFMEVAMK